ncbi:YcjF family protein [Vibrio sp. WXL210]|uniref:YcjF family protein n=1 Tax=Vibrio sp. WXL210 TaxID=3450709 RepID=UPI003EC7FA2A
MFDKIKAYINPSENPELVIGEALAEQPLPTLWLLGKTGAGKSSFIQAMTRQSSAEVGNGFAPCTQHAQEYLFPQQKPLLRFYDSRGLGEADYDPSDDLATLGESCHAIVALVRLDETEQGALLNALKVAKRQGKIRHLLLVNSHCLSVDDRQRERLNQFQHAQVEKAWGGPIVSQTVDFIGDQHGPYNLEPLIDKLSEILPMVALLASEQNHRNLEEQNFAHLEKEVLWYAGGASGSDLVPAVGLVSVPALQAKMLHSLANQYGLEWSKRMFSEFIAALGTSVALQYSIKLASRQVIKLIPGYGQTVGAVSAAVMSFATTYGLGRAACYYFYHLREGKPVAENTLREVYQAALKRGQSAAGHEKN